MKPTDYVQREEIRIDYAKIDVDGAPYVLPVRDILLTTVVPNGDSYRRFSTRRTLFDVSYASYKPGDATANAIQPAP